MSDLIFYLKGAFDGDGHYNGKTLIQINVIDMDFLETIKNIIKKEFNKDVKILKHTKAKGNCKAQYRINFYLKKEDGNFDEFKKLTPQTKFQKIQYLKGMFDAEGCISICDRPIERNGKKYVGKDKFLTLAQKSIEDLELWSSWLTELGITNTIMKRVDGRSRINIRQNDAIKKFQELIGFKIKRKKDKLEEAIRSMCKSPISQDESEKLLKIYLQTNFGATYIGKMFDRAKASVVKLLKRRGVYSSEKRDKITANDIDIAEMILGHELPFKIQQHRMKKFSAKGLSFSKIKSIKFHSKEKGYDLHTPKYHNFFLGNGILSHNSVLAQQIACYWCYQIEKIYGIKIPFSVKENIVFHGSELIKKGNKIGQKYKYGCLIFDEAGADLEGVKAMQKSTQQVKDFFRECGQYNMLNILCLPEFFDLPKGIATSRSNLLLDCFVTVGKDDMWERGKFNFFSAPKKKKLYRLGKKDLNYAAVKHDFMGDWDNVYVIDEKEYKHAKVVALKTREVVSAKEERMKSYLKGALKILVDDKDFTFREIARRISDKMRINANHKYIGRLLAGERSEEEEDDD